MNRTYNTDEHGFAMGPGSYMQQAIQSQPSQNTMSHRRQQSSFPPLDQIGSESTYFGRSRMAPPMDRANNRSRSPLKNDRRPENYRSRSPFQQTTSFDRPSRPQISNPRPLYPSREESPPRFALRSNAPTAYKTQQYPEQYQQQYQQHTRPMLPTARLPYPINDSLPSRPQLRVQPVQRAGPNPQEIKLAVPSIPYERKSVPVTPRQDAENRPTPSPRVMSEPTQPDFSADLVPKPLQLRKAPVARKEVTSMHEYLSLDELENLWQAQDQYVGLIHAPTKPCTPIFAMAPVGPLSPSLADHPAFRNEMPQYKNLACA